MTLIEQAAQRLAVAREIGREPVRWVAAPEAVAEIAAPELHGVPVQAGVPRSEWAGPRHVEARLMEQPRHPLLVEGSRPGAVRHP